jgi:ribonucrease Y
MTPYIYLVISLPVGFAIGVLFFKWRTESKIGRAKNHAEQIRSEARKEAEMILKDAQANVLKEEIKLKDQIAKEKDVFEDEMRKKEGEIFKEQLQLKDKENAIKQQVDEMHKKEKDLKSKEQSVEDKKRHVETRLEEVEAKHKEALDTLQKISGLTKEEVIEELKSQLINDAKNSVAKIIKDIKDQARDTADKEAKNIVVNAIQRTAADHSADTTLSVVNLPNDEIKGRIIGREGRNIRSFEQATGIEVIVDDTPGAVVLSGFDPYRRAIAKNALEKLIQDGRVHPGKIEEIVEKSKKELEKEIKELGENTCIDLGVHNLHPELMKLVGRLNYRTSYGQNVLLHSIECAKLCGLMAAELDYDVKLAVRAGILHDIGKAVDQYQEGTHVELGIELAKKYKENKIIINAIAAHHEDAPIMHPIASLVMAADAISSSRPGARRETLGNYLQRLEKLEAVAMGYDGVTKSYAIQAGREIRVLVENEQVDDARADMLASDIAEKIQNEMKYPGHIKVTVIREYRASSIAK